MNKLKNHFRKKYNEAKKCFRRNKIFVFVMIQLLTLIAVILILKHIELQEQIAIDREALEASKQFARIIENQYNNEINGGLRD